MTDTFQATGCHTYCDTDEVPAGGSALGTIAFLMPECYPQSMWVGKKIAFRDGRIVGYATVRRVLNPILLRDGGIENDDRKATVKLHTDENGNRQITLTADGLELTGFIAQTITEITAIKRWVNGVLFFSCNVGEEEIYDFTDITCGTKQPEKIIDVLKKIKAVEIIRD
jgi:hypothetical protein